MAAATSVTTTAVYFQIRRRCRRAGASTPGAPPIVTGLPVDLVCSHDHVLRHLDPEPGGGLEIDRELDRRDLLDGQVGGPRASEDAVDVAGPGSSDKGPIGSI